MTSVVDTSVKHFHNVMVGAPVLNGVAGALIGVLDACLVTGFDIKAATSLVVVDGVATLSFSGSHSATVDSVVLVAGSSIDALNGEQKVTAIASGVVKFATAQANATASGTITFKMAPAGWVKAFTGTNLAAYKSLDPASTGMYFRVDDTGTTAARVVGYEVMTDINTGVGPFPTAAQMSGGGYLNKSGVANANAVKWNVTADSRGFYLSVAAESAAAAMSYGANTRYIGDIIAFRPGGDPYAFGIGYSTSASTTNYAGIVDANGVVFATPRSYTGLGSSKLHLTLAYTGSPASQSGLDTLLGTFPGDIDGGLRLSRRFVAEGASLPPRGDLPGLFTSPQNQLGLFYLTNSIVSGSGEFSGRKLIAVNSPATTTLVPSSGVGCLFIDITGPWR